MCYIKYKRSSFNTNTVTVNLDKHNRSLRWLNTLFDTCVSFTFFSKTLDPSVVKNGSKLVNNTNFGFLMVKLTYVPLLWQHKYKQALKIGFVYLQKI